MGEGAEIHGWRLGETFMTPLIKGVVAKTFRRVYVAYNRCRISFNSFFLLGKTETHLKKMKFVGLFTSVMDLYRGSIVPILCCDVEMLQMKASR